VNGCALAARAASTAAWLLATIAVVAVTVRLAGAASSARSSLAFEFSRPPASPGAAVALAVGNLRLAAAVLLAALLAAVRPGIRPVLDVLVGALAALNATATGVAVGAYGTRLVAAVAAHAPLELAAFGVAGGAYLSGRRCQLDGRQLIVAATVSGLLLGAAAVLETYVQIGVGR
jgi:hypothetical protein